MSDIKMLSFIKDVHAIYLHQKNEKEHVCNIIFIL